MDDDIDRAYARAPTLDDLLTICRALAEQGARYLLIGGFAVVLHGFVRTTKDIDLLVDASDENIRRIKRALSVLPDRAIESKACPSELRARRCLSEPSRPFAPAIRQMSTFFDFGSSWKRADPGEARARR